MAYLDPCPGRARLALLIFGAVLSACTVTGGPPMGPEDTEATCHDGFDNDGDGMADCADTSCSTRTSCMGADGGVTDGGPRPDTGFRECVGAPYGAQASIQPVDLIWVVDTSGSMNDEAERVQENMARFATAIGAVGIDWRVVMISTTAFVDVPAELANDPRYRLVERDVFSDEPLQALLDEWDRYSDFLRRSALTHFVAVTDDDSSLSWEDFNTAMRRNLGRNYIFHTISSEDTGSSGGFPPTGACTTDGGAWAGDGAAAPGLEYYALAQATGGRAFSICTPSDEWAGLFDTLLEAVAIPVALPCEFEIPEPPNGAELDFTRVNIVYSPGTGDSTTFPNVQDDDGVRCTNGGWYYDDADAPSRIILCPRSCDLVNSDENGSVNVELGCGTLFI